MHMKKGYGNVVRELSQAEECGVTNQITVTVTVVAYCGSLLTNQITVL